MTIDDSNFGLFIILFPYIILEDIVGGLDVGEVSGVYTEVIIVALAKVV
jgi:hypothetical protein